MQEISATATAPVVPTGTAGSLTFRITRDRYGNFHPRILAILRGQENERESFEAYFTYLNYDHRIQS